MFDWTQFFDAYGIEYVTSGHNARKGNVGIACPLCGDDPSHHMGVSIEGKGWHCWRREEHSGKSPIRLIAAILKCSYTEAARIASSGETVVVTSDNNFSDFIATTLGKSTKVLDFVINELFLLDEFKPLKNEGFAGRLAFPYLKRRGYDVRQAEQLIDRYHLQFAVLGKFAYRIIAPIVQNKFLVNWTGRTVSSDPLRYKSLSTDFERASAQNLPPARMNIKDCLFDYDEIAKGGDTLVVTEGPFDAMRIGFLGEKHGVKGTALFSKSALSSQIDLLSQIGPKYHNRYVIFDKDAFDSILGLPEDLDFQSLILPEGIDDPAELDEKSFMELFAIE